MEMSEVMKADMAHAHPLCQALENPGNGHRVQGSTQEASKYQVAVP
jgi:hypothetical protein